MHTPPAPDQLQSLLAEAFTAALVARDPREAARVVREAIDAGLGQATIDEDVVAPAMRRVGDLWRRGEITVADEHLATDISFRVLALQREAFRVADRRTRERVMLAAVEGERHVLGLEMAGSLLRHEGFDVRMLGADLPIDSLAWIVERHRPAIFGFTVTMPAARDLLPLAIDEVRRSAPSIGIMVGGQGAPEDLSVTDRLIAVSGVATVVEEADALLQRPSLN
jgi:methanogenic corrinoid protein MtbC1